MMNYNYSSFILTTQEHDDVLIEGEEPFIRLFKDDNKTAMITPSSASSSRPAPVNISCDKSTRLAVADGQNNESKIFEAIIADNEDANLLPVEPTPIDRSSAFFVDILDHSALDRLLLRSKQDEDNYDFFIKSFSSGLVVTTTEQTLTPISTLTVTTTTTHHPSSLTLSEHPGQLDQELLQFEKEQESILQDGAYDTYDEDYDVVIVPMDQEETETSSSSNLCSPSPSSPSPSPSLSSDSSSLSASSTLEAAANGNHMTHVELWNQRYQELIQFKELSGHCLVPLNWPMNPPLARWVKRQRYQYQIKYRKNRSLQKEQHHNSSSSSAALTDEREQALEHLGFTWDSHALSWQERLGEFLQYQESNGHTRIPKKCIQFPQLPIWVKRQRRQYQLWKQGKKSQMTQERLQELLSVGFCFGRSYQTTTNNTNTTTTTTK